MKRSDIPRDSGAVVGCYSVHLYCTHPLHDTVYDARWSEQYGGEFIGGTEVDCLRAARADGWWNDLRAVHLNEHLTDGRSHDDCRMCIQRRVHGGNGTEPLPLHLPYTARENHEPRELVCSLCGVDYPVWSAPNDLYNAVMRLPDGSDRLPFPCPTCFARMAAESGVGSRFRLSLDDP